MAWQAAALVLAAFAGAALAWGLRWQQRALEVLAVLQAEPEPPPPGAPVHVEPEETPPYLKISQIGRLHELEAELTALEKKEQHEQSLFEALFDRVPGLLCIADRERFLHLSREFEHILGWTRDELRAKPWREFVHPDDLGKVAAASVAMNERRIADFEARYACKTGGYRRLRWDAAPWDQNDDLTFCTAEPVGRRKAATAEAGDYVPRFGGSRVR